MSLYEIIKELGYWYTRLWKYCCCFCWFSLLFIGIYWLNDWYLMPTISGPPLVVVLMLKRIPSVFMYAMNIQNDVIGLVLRENCKSKQVTDFIAWPSRCHSRHDIHIFIILFRKYWFCIVHYVFNPDHYIGIVNANTTLLYKYRTDDKPNQI